MQPLLCNNPKHREWKQQPQNLASDNHGQPHANDATIWHIYQCEIVRYHFEERSV